ncbi:sensor histidine kinase [Algimonas arctica]|uniref:histidine kinase n=1 Tax=Algimonas arctica TaxID=1479486 RepID=A0A8J3CPK1_9PROT|nr:ATP-binding protein [Algimonas arctica]GHA91742.1 sensor histidine kinase [Algimonas arctica]
MSDKPARVRRGRDKRRRFVPRRFLLSSRLTQLILAANLIGLSILVIGSLAMNRFEEGLIDGKVDNLNSLAATITTVMGDRATGSGQASELDIDKAKQVLRGINVPEGWRVRLHDRAGHVVADTAQLDDRIVVGTLDPIRTEETVAELPKGNISETLGARVLSATQKLPWRQAHRDRLRRDLKADIRTALTGEPVSGARYDIDDTLIVMATQPVYRVQQVLGTVTVESSDVSGIVNAERRALAPIIGLALIAALLSSFALILFITLPMRKLARAAERVARNPQDFETIPDLSHRRDEIGDLSVVLRDMTRGLYSRVDDIANFAADVAHEIKNPLTSLRSASETLRVARSDEDRDKLIDIISQDVARMNRLITDISNASKVDANLAKETAQTLDVAEIVANITMFYEQTKSGPGADVVDLTDLAEPVFIRAFETPFAQVLRNLIDNALTFSADEGVVEITARSDDDWVTLTIKDYGPGIPPGNLDTVFDRFYTQRPQGAKFGSHSGLGLAICRQIVTAHKGRIWAENWLDKAGDVGGAQFYVEVPRQTSGGAPAASRRNRD